MPGTGSAPSATTTIDAYRLRSWRWLSGRERDTRLFYAQLYIGLNHAIEDQPDAARRHLREAVASPWGRDPASGYGPHYMWHVGRVHYDLLIHRERAAAKAAADPPRIQP